jgi:hypothetical protein
LAARLKALTQKYSRKAEAFSDQPEDAAAKQIEELEKEMFADMKKAEEEILLPFQRDRLRQIRLQAALGSGGSQAVVSEAFADLLHLTAEQKKELQKKAIEAEQKLNREIGQLRQKLHREALEEVLTQSQLRTLDKNLGKPIADPSRR